MGGIWSSNATNDTINNGVVTGLVMGTDTIRYIVTNVCGIDTAVMAITINPLPFAGVIVGNNNVCIGSALILADATVGGLWSSSNANATVSAGIAIGQLAGIDTIWYMVTNVCGTDTASHVIYINAYPGLPIIATQFPSSICSGTLFQNFAAATPPPIGITYNWSAENATVWATSPNGQYALISFPNSGTAVVNLASNFYGHNCATIASKTVDVTTTVAPLASVLYFQYHFVCLPSDEDSYQWGYDDVATLDSTVLVGEINQDYLNATPDFANKYYWVMTSKSGCNQKTYFTVPLTVQDLNKSTDASINVYPNPATELINIAINTVIEGSFEVEVVNMTGQQMSQAITQTHKATIDVAKLPAGIYMVNCYNNGIKIANSRFVKN